jgi:succinate dehydrogenase/fumarate reductase cytochrome b subunit
MSYLIFALGEAWASVANSDSIRGSCRAMAWKPSISESISGLFLAFYLLAIVLELALSRLKVVKAGYETRDSPRPPCSARAPRPPD